MDDRAINWSHRRCKSRHCERQKSGTSGHGNPAQGKKEKPHERQIYEAPRRALPSHIGNQVPEAQASSGAASDSYSRDVVAPINRLGDTQNMGHHRSAGDQVLKRQARKAEPQGHRLRGAMPVVAEGPGSRPGHPSLDAHSPLDSAEGTPEARATEWLASLSVIRSG
ncbi:hypothetical protein RF11_13043 [Thelohanellus kitauei]|uniref:Uncharacterized protein n=1 Tax=Thelohanellus kitauei TaxID=669202 RepID=A0A0C2NDF4_THEKT|nr:hypothetical protein RF11_13043 [Thelohanellus kitauei]